jgi:accessory gene regulator B
MEKLAKSIAASIGKNLGKSEEEIAVIAYGLIGILQILAILVISLTIGICFGFWAEVLTIFFSVGFLRRLTGGAHSRGLYNCLVYSVCFVCGFSAICVFLLTRVSFYHFILPAHILIYVFGYVTIALKAPVAPPNKPCRTEEKRRRLRRGSFIVLTVFFILNTTLLFFGGYLHQRLYTVGLSLAVSVLWQIFMMTKSGHAMIYIIDGAFLHNHKGT